jgi:hypothetical protein
MTVNPEAWLLALIILLLALPIGLLLLLWRAERRMAELSSAQEWRKASFSRLAPAEVVQYRARAKKTLQGPVFVFEDSQRREMGRWEGATRYRGRLLLGERSFGTYIQQGSSHEGKLGAENPRSIVVRDDTGILAELEPTQRYPGQHYRVRVAGLELRVEASAWSASAEATIWQGEEVVAQYRRLSGLAQHVVLAARPDLPLEAVAVLLYLSLLR